MSQLFILLQCWLKKKFFAYRLFLFILLTQLFFRANLKWCRLRKSNRLLGSNPVYEVLIVTFITAFVSFFNPYTRKSSSSLIKQVPFFKQF